MRLNVHDFSGHPFQVQLSRELALRGHEVVHNFSTQYITGHGRLAVTPDDADSLAIEGITCPVVMSKYSPAQRIRFELSYAQAWIDHLESQPGFDIVVACNVPLFTLARMRRYFAARGQRWVLWHQDLYSLGVGAEARRRLPVGAGALVDRFVQRMEMAQVSSASGVVAITPAMPEKYADWGVPRPDARVIANWAPLDDITPDLRDNAWARAHGLSPHRVRVMYAGTLGRKHNPMLLLQMLDAVRGRGIDAELIVASEGVGAHDLTMAAGGRDDVRVVGYQKAESLSAMLASADVVVALLEPDAARFSVPSKVLTYLCAGRPIVALVPAGNPAACDVERAGGFVGAPTPDGATAAAQWIRDTVHDGDALARIGSRARTLATRLFDITRIADRFENLFVQIGSPTAPEVHTGESVVADHRKDFDAADSGASVA